MSTDSTTEGTTETGSATLTWKTSGATEGWTSRSPEWAATGGQSPSAGSQFSQPTTTSEATEQATSATLSNSGEMLSSTTTNSTTTEATTLTPSPGGLQLDQNAIIAGVLVGVLMVAIILVGVCLAKARRRRSNGTTQHGKTPRPTPGGVATVIAREPNPYTNACFAATKEEMGERMHQSEEPAIIIPGAVNSIRNKEATWIIPLEELAEDDTTANFDTTRF